MSRCLVLFALLFACVGQPSISPSASDGGNADASATRVDAAADAADAAAPSPQPDGPQARFLAQVVRFYGAQRCGDGANWLYVDNPSGATCHLQDGPALAAGVDLSGGWHDAGDGIKFTLTIAWASYALLKGYDAFPSAYRDDDGERSYGTPNGAPDLLDQVRYATDYLVRTHVSTGVLVARVGGDQDHDLWVTSPYQSTLSVAQGGGERPVMTGARADVAGITAAALALMSRLYQAHDPVRAATYLAHARDIYQIGRDNPGTTPDNFYPDNSWRDDMLCGAIELYRATGIAAYLAQAREYDAALGSHGWVVDWSNAADYGRHSMVVTGDQDALTRWRTDVDRYLTVVSTERYVDGLAWFLDWGSLRYATGAAFSAALLHQATGVDRYREFALGQLAYVQGRNEYGRSFVVGWGENPPGHPHHANAYGHDALDWDLSKPFRHSLVGALVGGPTKGRADVSAPGYVDDIDDYVGNEVTIDYNSGLAGLAAFAATLE